MDIQQKIALITGAASGLGEATARHLAELGARVVIADVQTDKAEALAQELGGLAVTCDVSDAASAEAAFASVKQQLGLCQILVNCAGIGIPAKVMGKDGPMPLDTFAKVIQINLIGSFNMVRLAATHMAEADANADGERGVIVSTASIAAYEGQIGQAAYAASKGGVASMTLPIARELTRQGIRVLTIAPGLFRTPMFESLKDEVIAALEASVPFPSRLGKPAEFALLVEHMVRNPMLNGEVVRLDAALRMQPK